MLDSRVKPYLINRSINLFVYRSSAQMASGPADIRELSFQNVIDTILKPAGVKVGGYPDDIFNDLTDDEKDKWCCNVWSVTKQDYMPHMILYRDPTISSTHSHRGR